MCGPARILALRDVDSATLSGMRFFDRIMDNDALGWAFVIGVVLLLGLVAALLD